MYTLSLILTIAINVLINKLINISFQKKKEIMYQTFII